MKTPFRSILITRNAVGPLGVSATACTVTAMFPSSEQASVEIPLRSGSITKVVSFADLASTPEKAAEKINAAVAQIFQASGADQKSAALETAGAASVA